MIHRSWYKIKAACANKRHGEVRVDSIGVQCKRVDTGMRYNQGEELDGTT